MSQEPISQEQLKLTIEYLNYVGPIFSNLPVESEINEKHGTTKAAVLAAF
ncbi:MAG: hypothetical protein JSV04_09930 [Candidatus Heimdallarchaeota archaeon]|nr:MAG: hypothetical protein JSV04_09930 [Candidatus Heimdallarchaeota archaeon]